MQPRQSLHEPHSHSDRPASLSLPRPSSPASLGLPPDVNGVKPRQRARGALKSVPAAAASFPIVEVGRGTSERAVKTSRFSCIDGTEIYQL